ncbi:hypothetical protein QBC42DRAFT_253314 [Cladorrhinum samala]|uniref:Carbohydrate-binding module family 18 protein n=1 Tax=Cladorrhinum samala TaxID=585594 RepID=A0AAV9HKV0_9PEZI|nr:hypothetical protein QBC42DRAFT_253314 [Cladorrhinum samala]
MVSSTAMRALLASSALLFSGVSAACTKYIEAHQGDTCAALAQAAGITVGQFINSNPGVASCSDLVVGGRYCIEGKADAPPTASASAAPTTPSPGLTVSLDGNCGSGVTCSGSRFGNCCSAYGFCGSTSDHCLGDCQSAFGSCGSGAISSPGGTSPTITAPPAGSVTVTVTSVVAVTRTTLFTSTSTVLTTQTTRVTATATATVTNTVGQTQTARATITVTNTVQQTVAATATTTQTVRTTQTVLTTNTVQEVVRTTQTVLTTNTVQVTRTVPATATATATSYAIVTLTTISTSYETLTSIKTSTLTTTRTIQTVVPVTETLTSILTSITTRVVTSGVCGQPTPTRPSIVTTTQVSGGKPTPTLPGTPTNCRNFAIIQGDDTCRKLAQRYDLSLLDFYALNPSVSKNNIIGDLICTLDLLLSGLCQINCDALWEGYYVCVGK